MNSSGKVLIGALTGIAVGLTVGILYAPQSGKKTRKNIQRKAEDLKHDFEDWKKSAEDKLSEIKDKAESYVKKTANDVNAKKGEILK